MTLAGTRPPTLDEWNKYELHHRARLLCNDEDIADAISDTILVCWEKFSQLKEDRYFRTWMGGGMIGYQNNSSDDYVYAYATDRIIDPDQIAYFLFINDDAPIGEQGMTEDNFYEVAVGENQQGDR